MRGREGAGYWQNRQEAEPGGSVLHKRGARRGRGQDGPSRSTA